MSLYFRIPGGDRRGRKQVLQKSWDFCCSSSGEYPGSRGSPHCLHVRNCRINIDLLLPGLWYCRHPVFSQTGSTGDCNWAKEARDRFLSVFPSNLYHKILLQFDNLMACPEAESQVHSNFIILAQMIFAGEWSCFSCF